MCISLLQKAWPRTLDHSWACWWMSLMEPRGIYRMGRGRQDWTFALKDRRHSFEKFGEAEREGRALQPVQLLEEVRRLVRKFASVAQDLLDVAVQAAKNISNLYSTWATSNKKILTSVARLSWNSTHLSSLKSHETFLNHRIPLFSAFCFANFLIYKIESA